MLLCVYAKAFAGSTAEQIATAAAAGFEGVELRGDADGVPLTRLPSTALAELARVADGAGVRLATLALGMLERLADDLDGLRHVGGLAASLGARVRLFSSARPGVRTGPDAFGEPGEPLLAAEAARLRACCDALAAGGLRRGAMLEAEPYSIANTTARQARLFALAEVEDIGFNWDFVNGWMGGEHPWPGPWAHLAGRLRGLHYKGAKADPHEPTRYASQALPGSDHLPHAAIWSTLRASGFDGPVTVDPHYGLFAEADRFTPEPALPDAEICRRTLPILRALRDSES